MARRQNEDVGPAGLIFLAVAIFGALILTAAVYLPPTALLIALLYFELRAPFTSKDFALTGEEKIRLSKFDCYRNAIGINFQRVKEEGSDLKQNRDGSFHRGSKLGMQLNNKLEELQAVQDELDRRTHAIARRSRTTFDRWSRIKSFQFALRCTVVGYVLSIVILYLLDPVFVDSFSQFVGHHVLMRISGVDNAIYGSILISSIGAGILVWPIYKLRRSALERNAEALGVSTDYFPDEMEHVTSNPAIDWDQYFEAILD